MLSQLKIQSLNPDNMGLNFLLTHLTDLKLCSHFSPQFSFLCKGAHITTHTLWLVSLLNKTRNINCAIYCLAHNKFLLHVPAINSNFDSGTELPFFSLLCHRLSDTITSLFSFYCSRILFEYCARKNVQHICYTHVMLS